MQRLYYFDYIRIVLILFVIFQHTGMAYVPVAEGWPIVYTGPLPFASDVIISSIGAISSAFAMALFLFISAYLLVGSFDRKGRRTFLRDRFERIGVPLVAFSLFFWVLGGFGTFSFGYLWFLVALLFIAVVYSVWRGFKVTIPPVSCPGNGTLVLAALAVGAASFVVRIWYGIDDMVLWHGIEPAHLPLYVLMVVGGILAYRNGWLDVVAPSVAKVWGIIAAVTVCSVPVIFTAFGSATAGGFTLIALVTAFWEAFLGVSLCVSLLLVFKNRWNVAGRVKAALARSVYAVYLIQLPIILILQWWFIHGGILLKGLPALTQFILVGVLASVFCFLISNYIVRRIPYAKRILF